MSAMEDSLRRKASGLLAAWMALVSSGAPAALAHDARESALDEVRRAFSAAEAALAELPRDAFEPAAVVAKLGKEPTALFAFVRDQTALVPYRGALRGPSGVLQDRVGNDLDRALLLASLLREAGCEVRLASGTLDAEGSARVEAALSEPPLPRAPFSNVAKEVLRRAIEQQKLDVERVFASIEKAEADAAARAAELAARSRDQTAALASIVRPAGAAGTAPPPATAPPIREHWWVQWKNDDAWSDLDPTLRETLPGQALTPASETIAPEQLPAKHFHEIDFRVVIERFEGGKFVEAPVLTHVLRPAELHGTRLALGHLAPDWPKELDLTAADAPARLRAAALAQKRWAPVLTVGMRTLGDRGFTEAGKIEQFGSFLNAEVAGARVGDLLRGGLGGGPARNSFGSGDAAESVLTAEWLEYEIRVPGEKPRCVRRDVFDLVGPAARRAQEAAKPALDEAQRAERALALLGGTEMLVLPCRLAPELVDCELLRGLVRNREALIATVEKPGSNEVAAAIGNLTPIPAPLYALALLRGGAGPVAAEAYLDRANVFTRLSRLRVEGSEGEGELRGCIAFDIVANEVAVRRGASGDPFVIRLTQGVVDTNAEALLLSGCGRVENTAELFADSASGDWIALRGLDDAAVTQLAVPPDVRARIEADLAIGAVVIAPPTTLAHGGRPLYGWWRIDPRNGDALGMGSRGGGSGATEYSLTQHRVVMGIVISAGCIFLAASSSDRDLAAFLIPLCVLAGASSLGGLFATGELATMLGFYGDLFNLLATVGAVIRTQTGPR